MAGNSSFSYCNLYCQLKTLLLYLDQNDQVNLEFRNQLEIGGKMKNIIVSAVLLLMGGFVLSVFNVAHAESLDGAKRLSKAETVALLTGLRINEVTDFLIDFPGGFFGVLRSP